MESDLISLLNGKNFIVYLLLCFSQVFCLFVFFIIYKTLPSFIKAMQDIANEMALLREMLKSMEHKVEHLQADVAGVEVISADNRRRLNELEQKGKL